MAIVKNTQANNGNVSGGSARVAGSGGFVNLREIIGKADDEINGGNYAWQERARPQNDQAREYLASFKDDSKEKRTGRDTWDGESKQKMSDFDRIAAGLSKWGDSLQVEAGGDLSKNIFNSTIGTVFSPVSAFGSFVGNAYEAATGKPVTEGDDEGYMPDYELDSNEKAAAGANAAIDPTRPDAQEAFAQVLDGGANVVIECVGNTPAVKSAFQFAGKGATILLFSVPKVDATFDLPLFDVYKKELTIKGSFVNPDTHDRAVRLINSGKVDFSSIITHRFTLDQLPEAIAMQMSSESIKVVVEAK